MHQLGFCSDIFGVFRNVHQFVLCNLLGLSLMWVAIMGVIVIYIYALIGFAFFRASFDTDESRFCSTLAECFVTVLRYGAVGELTEVMSIRVCSPLQQYVVWSQKMA